MPAGSGAGRWSAPPATTVIRDASTPIDPTSAATSRDGTTTDAALSRTRISAASCHRTPRGVVASGCRRHATSWTVMTSALWLERRRRGAASDIACTTSKPPGAWTSPWSHARVRSGPGSRDERTGRPKRANGSPAERAVPTRGTVGRLARSVTSMPSPSAVHRASPSRSPRVYTPMPPGTRRRSCSTTRSTRGRLLRHACHPPRRGRGPRGRRRNVPRSTGRTSSSRPRPAGGAVRRPPGWPRAPGRGRRDRRVPP